MKALVTGASSGIGKDIARYLASKNVDLVLVARRENALLELKQELDSKVNVTVYPCDLKDLEKTKSLASTFNDVDILINNAGFGDAGEFINTSLEKELDMVDVNIKAMHVLFKTFLEQFVKNNKTAYVLNVASLAAFQAGPKMATYYASKAYVLHLSEAVAYELKKRKLPIHVTCLCPGPVATEFNKVANVKFHLKEISSKKVAKLAIDKMFKKKLIVIPGFKGKAAIFFERFVSRKMTNRIICKAQDKKIGSN